MGSGHQDGFTEALLFELGENLLCGEKGQGTTMGTDNLLLLLPDWGLLSILGLHVIFLAFVTYI